MKKLLTTLAMCCFLCCAPAFAASLQPGPNVSLQTPGDWESVSRDFAILTHPAVYRLLNAVDAGAPELKQVGWLMKGNTLQGAYSVSFRQSGMGKALRILQEAKGAEREKAANTFADTFAGVIQAGYDKRGVHVGAITAEIIEAGADMIMVMDTMLRDESGEFMRSETVFLHGDSMLSISAVHDLKAGQSVAAQLEAIPLSVQWKN
ncbi:MAG: hypothetical protein FWG04_01865 [Desulfovibrionaceae bacterium]|nr:hypothetical protein [Desulfovibrionaceae bacterium]